MDKEYVKELNFDSDTFSQMKLDADFVMQRLFGRMLESETTEGSMTIKIDVELQDEYVPNNDPDAESDTRKINKPKFKHKVTSSIKISEEKSGNLNTEMELVFDEETGTYIMKPISGVGVQRTIFECYEDEKKPTEAVEAPGLIISDRSMLAIEGTVDGVEDAEESDEDEEPVADYDPYDISDEMMDGVPDYPFSENDMPAYDYDDPEDEV